MGNNNLNASPQAGFCHVSSVCLSVADYPGFHATDAESFAEAMHQALSLSSSQASSMRKAARALAKEKFSQRAFERSFEESWAVLKAKARGRREMVDKSELDKMNRR